MAYTIATAHTNLAYRIGETAAPTDTTELSRRLSWFCDAIRKAAGGDELMWYMEKFATDTVVADKPYYDLPTRFRKMNQFTVDNYRYTQIPQIDVYPRYEVPNAPVPIKGIDLDRTFYIYNSQIRPIPIPDTAPTAVTITITQTGGTATATSTTAHGYNAGDYITVAGAGQSGYNGTIEILTVPTTLTFTYAVDSGTVSPATGTITATWRNVEMWYYEYPNYPTGSSSGIVVPDEYIDMLVAYAEGRYWSTAHKRGKSADAFTEFETRLNDMKKENTRKKFYDE